MKLARKEKYNTSQLFKHILIDHCVITVTSIGILHRIFLCLLFESKIHFDFIGYPLNFLTKVLLYSLINYYEIVLCFIGHVIWNSVPLSVVTLWGRPPVTRCCFTHIRVQTDTDSSARSQSVPLCVAEARGGCVRCTVAITRHSPSDDFNS